RIDRLAPQHKQLLQTAAVIGKDVPYALLQAVADMPEVELRRALTTLQAAEFLYETALFPDPEYTFKHALTHEVAYASILQDRRRVTHARIAEAMEEVYRARLPEYAERLGQHAIRGELWQKAYAHLRQAGAKALAGSANAEAIRCYEQALVALAHLPQSPPVLEQAIDLRIELRSALHPLGHLERVSDMLRQAERLAETLGDRRRQGKVLSYLAQAFRLAGDYSRAIDAGERAVRIADAFGDPSIEAPANFHLGQAFFQLGDYACAADYHWRNIRTLDGDAARDRLGMAGFPVVFSRGHLSWSLAELGRFAEGISAWQQAMQLADEVKHPFSQAFARYCGGFLYLRKGEVDRAVSQLEPGLAMCRSMHVRLELPFVAAFLGVAYALQGRLAEGVKMVEDAVEEATALKIMSGLSWLTGLLAYSHLIAGRTARAAEHVKRAHELAQKYAERGWI